MECDLFPTPDMRKNLLEFKNTYMNIAKKENIIEVCFDSNTLKF